LARRIVKQPNGLFACWSTIVDDFIETDLTQEEYIEMRVHETSDAKRNELKRIFAEQMNFMDYEEALQIKKEIHG
jgi:hypothetical protein